MENNTTIAPISKDELLKLHTTLSTAALEVMKKKNQDYTGGSDDPFANFRGSLAMGVEPEIGLMIRMTDKLQRVKSFIAHGELAVANEDVMDIGHDLINYSVLLMGLLMERRLSTIGLEVTNEDEFEFETVDTKDKGQKQDKVVPNGGKTNGK